MIRRLRESDDNTFYCAECTYDKSNGTMFLYTTDITEVRGSVKPKDSLKVEGGFLVRRKYFRSEYEAQDYIDSLPNAMPMSRNESIRRNRYRGLCTESSTAEDNKMFGLKNKAEVYDWYTMYYGKNKRYFEKWFETARKSGAIKQCDTRLVPFKYFLNTDKILGVIEYDGTPFGSKENNYD